jgi:uncharacterized protein YbjQ (UPF0145 family)
MRARPRADAGPKTYRKARWLWIGFALAALLSSGMFAEPAAARNTRYLLKIDDVKQDPRYAENVPRDVAFYFAGQAHPAPQSSYGEVVTNRKGNSFGRPDEEACRWTMISALKQLHQRARELGGDAVIDIVSYYRKQVYSSETEYECHAGGFVAGVALKGTIVKLGK